MTIESGSYGHTGKRSQANRPHKPWDETIRRAQCGKSARCVRGGGGWKRRHGLAAICHEARKRGYKRKPLAYTNRASPRPYEGT